MPFDLPPASPINICVQIIYIPVQFHLGNMFYNFGSLVFVHVQVIADTKSGCWVERKKEKGKNNIFPHQFIAICLLHLPVE